MQKSVKFLGIVLIFSFFFFYANNQSLAAWSEQTSNAGNNDINTVDFYTNLAGVFGKWTASSGYLTTNGGTTWTSGTSLPPTLIKDISITDSNTVYAVNNSSTAYKSKDGGNNYSSSSISGSASIAGIKALSSDYIFAVGNNSSNRAAIYKTINGGTNWTNVWTDNEIGCLEDIDCIQSGTNYSCIAVGKRTVGNTPLIIKRTLKVISDELWLTSALSGSYLWDVSQLDDFNAYVVGTDNGSDAVMYKTTNGGSTPSSWNTVTTGATTILNGVDFIDTNVGWIVGNDEGEVRYTVDGGSNWTAQTTTIPNVNFNSVKARSAGLAWAAGDSDGVSGKIINWTDTTGPTTAFTTSLNTYYNATSWDALMTSTIQGTTSDEDKTTQSGTKETDIRIQRSSDSNYWTGSTWGSSTDLATSGSATSWAYSSLSSTNLGSDSDGTLTLTGVGKDYANNEGTDQKTTIYDNTAPSTTASPASGSYTSAQTITLSASDATSGVAGTYYSTDGSDPTTNSIAYSGPISISETTTLKFFSIDNAGNSETFHTEIYTITIPTPTPEPTPEEEQELQQKNLQDGKQITVNSNLQGQTISGQNLIIYFKKVNDTNWMKWKRHNKYPKKWKNKKKTALKRYWKQTNNYTKSQKFKFKITFKYSNKLFKKLRKKDPKLKKKDLTLKVKVNKKKWKKIKKVWKNAKIKHKKKKNRFIVKYFNKFPKKTYRFGIGLK